MINAHSNIYANVSVRILLCLCRDWYRWIVFVSVRVASWSSYQIREIAGCHAPGLPGTFSLPRRVNDPDMHHGKDDTDLNHIPICSLTENLVGFLPPGVAFYRWEWVGVIITYVLPIRVRSSTTTLQRNNNSRPLSRIFTPVRLQKSQQAMPNIAREVGDLLPPLYFRVTSLALGKHDDVIKWKHFPRYWPFVRGIHRSPVNSPHKGQWRGALIFTLICVWINGCVNNREAGDLRRYCAHYGVTVMFYVFTRGLYVIKRTYCHISRCHAATGFFFFLKFDDCFDNIVAEAPFKF